MLVMSIIEIPALEVPCDITASLNQIRVLQRDLVGKSCWDISPLYCSSNSIHQKGMINLITIY